MRVWLAMKFLRTVSDAKKFVVGAAVVACRVHVVCAKKIKLKICLHRFFFYVILCASRIFDVSVVMQQLLREN